MIFARCVNLDAVTSCKATTINDSERNTLNSISKRDIARNNYAANVVFAPSALENHIAAWETNVPVHVCVCIEGSNRMKQL